MKKDFVFVDFNNMAEGGQVRLDCVGTRDDLQRLGVQLENGMVLEVADGDLAATIIVRSSSASEHWCGEIIDGPHERGSTP